MNVKRPPNKRYSFFHNPKYDDINVFVIQKFGKSISDYTRLNLRKRFKVKVCNWGSQEDLKIYHPINKCDRLLIRDTSVQ